MRNLNSLLYQSLHTKSLLLPDYNIVGQSTKTGITYIVTPSYLAYELSVFSKHVDIIKTLTRFRNTHRPVLIKNQHPAL